MWKWKGIMSREKIVTRCANFIEDRVLDVCRWVYDVIAKMTEG
jgi:hypothetical protein